MNNYNLIPQKTDLQWIDYAAKRISQIGKNKFSLACREGFVDWAWTKCTTSTPRALWDYGKLTGKSPAWMAAVNLAFPGGKEPPAEYYIRWRRRWGTAHQTRLNKNKSHRTWKLPDSACQKIAQDACHIAAEYMRLHRPNPWKGGERLKPIHGNDLVGIDIGKMHAYRYQNWGTHAFLPQWTDGRKIPMYDPIAKRKVVRTVSNLGQPGTVIKPVYDRHTRKWSYQEVWRPMRWFNPGIKTTYFLNHAIKKAFRQNQNLIDKYPQARTWHFSRATQSASGGAQLQPRISNAKKRIPPSL